MTLSMNEQQLKQLEKGKCVECSKEVTVVRIEPIDIDVYLKYVTGMYFWNIDDDYNYLRIGELCNDCAKRLCADGYIFCSDDAIACSKYFERETP